MNETADDDTLREVSRAKAWMLWEEGYAGGGERQYDATSHDI